MGKKRNRPSFPPTWATVYLNKFLASGEDTHVFDASLTSVQRGAIHNLSRDLGLKSKSVGKGDQRRLTITKLGPGEVRKSHGKRDAGVRKKLPPREIPNLQRVSFTQEARPVLRDLFTRYPPSDSDTTESALSLYTGHLGKRSYWRDDFFLKPNMKKEDILDRVASLSNRLAKDKAFQEVFAARSKLPIATFKEAIITAVESSQVVLIAGETGCGKTTQVPQFLLDNMWYSKHEPCKIICTQPRRISAISVSERISWERGETIGNNIGYKVRLQSQGGRQSSVVFCTNGVMLRVLVGKGVGSHLPDITHIIVDEIHERDCYSDFMLAIIRDLLPSNPHLRLILMSATLDAERFSGYFGGCPVVRVPGFTYPVKTFYLEDVLSVVKSDENDNRIYFSGEDKVTLDRAIDLAWANDEFDDLLDLVSCEGSKGIYNYPQSSTWLTPLMVFAGKGRVSDVCKLLSLGADFKLKSKEGITALELAEKENQFETAQIIREHADKFQSNSQQAQDLLDKYMAACNSEDVDVALIVQLMKKICCDSEDGAFLVFLPGWDEISKTKEKLLCDPFFANGAKFNILCLHSRIPAEEQKRVFNRSPQGCRKIVLATNIAESAVTIDDVVYVIDSGRMKEKSYDPYSDVATLQSSWVSKANAKQREGRAGRCQPGICYHLYSKLRAASLPEFGVPEVRRMPVDELCLQVKILEPSCNVYDFLQKLMDPPVSQSITNALTILKDIGALTSQEELTELGHKFGQLPVHPRMSKMLYFAILVNCLEPALILACAADSKDPFVMPMTADEKKKAAAMKHKFASLYGGYSDHLATVAAFQCWKIAKKNGQSHTFCSQSFVSLKAIQMLDNMREKLHGELKRHGLIPKNDSKCSLNAYDPGILRAVVAVGLYPMVGRMCPPSSNSGKSLVEIITGAKVKVRSLSNNSKMSSNTQDEALIVFDEITRGDWDVHIRSCTVLPTISLLLFSGEIAVAPIGSWDVDESDDKEDHRDVMDTEKSGLRPGEKIMLAPENFVQVVVDQWLPFKLTAFEIAQMYILRDRLMASILFKVKHPEENLPAHLGASIYAIACMLSYDGLAQPSIRTVQPSPPTVQPSPPTEAVKPTPTVQPSPPTVALKSTPTVQPSPPVEEITPSDLSIGNEQIEPKSANNLDLGNMEKSMPSDPANGNEQTEPKSANILDLVNMENDIPADLANGNAQTGPETSPIEAVSAAKQSEKKRSRSMPRGQKSAENLDIGNMPSDQAKKNDQTEPKSTNILNLENMRNNIPSDRANGNEQPEPNTAPMEAASAAEEPKKKRPKSKKQKSENNLDLGNMPSDMNEQTEPKLTNILNLENLPSDLANGNEQTEPNTAPMEAASAAEQPKKKRSKSKKRKSDNNLDLGNMPSDRNEQTEPKSTSILNLENMKNNIPSDLANGNEQPEPNTAPMEASSAAEQPKKKRSKSKKRKSDNSLDLGNMPSDMNEQTEPKLTNILNLENLPSDLANGNEQPEPNTAPMKAASAAEQPKKKPSRSKKRKSDNNLDLGNMPSDLNEQTEPKSTSILNLENMKNDIPSDLANGNEQPEPNTAPIEASSAAEQPKKKRSKSKKRKSDNNLDLGNVPSDQNDQTEPKSTNILNLENMPSDQANGNEQTEPNTAPMEAVSATQQPEKKQSKSKRRKLANNLDLGNMDENTPDLPNEQTELNGASAEADSAAKHPKKKHSKSKRHKSATNMDSGNNLEERKSSPNGIEQPLNNALTEAILSAKQLVSEEQMEPESVNTAPTEAAALENNQEASQKVDLQGDEAEEN